MKHAVLLTALTLALAPLVGHTQEARIKVWDTPTPASVAGYGFGVNAGSAQLEEALAKIIPQPYKIRLDGRVPRTMMLTWPQSADWMQALLAATRPVGLVVEPDWSVNTITIVTAQRTALAAPAPVAAPVAAPAAPAAPAVAMPSPAPLAATPIFDVQATDRTVRETLARWAKSAGWTHDMSHWTLDRDHPIEGLANAAQFGTDFRTATRTLLASTENTDRPAQPCFYSNAVVRVIPKAELCDRSVAQQ